MGVKTFLVNNSPIILTIAGVGLIGTGTVLACRATLKAQEIINQHHYDRNEMEQEIKDGDMPGKGEKGYTQNLAKMYGTTLWSLTKTYILPVSLIGAGVACILGGHKILNDRYVKASNALAATTTAYNELNKFIKKYRKNVISDAGEAKDKQYAYGLSNDKVDTVDADGKKTKISKEDLHTKENVTEKDISDFEKVNPYVFVFDKRSCEYRTSTSSNLAFLQGQLNAWNQIYKSRRAQSLSDGIKHPIKLDEVLDSMDLPHKQLFNAKGEPIGSAGSILGWDPTDPNSDGYISFGIDEVKFPQNESWLCGYSSALVLEFNCDGVVNTRDMMPVDYDIMNK